MLSGRGSETGKSPPDCSGNQAEYETGVVHQSRSPAGSSSSSGSASPVLEEPFSSSLFFIEEQRQRLDSSSTSSNSTRFRCAPRREDSDEEENFLLESPRSRGSSSSDRGVDLARRFLTEGLPDEPLQNEPTAATANNDDLWGFLRQGRGDDKSDSEANIWRQNSERNLAVDQSVNLMDTSSYDYQDEPPVVTPRSTSKRSRLDGKKNPFSFLIKQPKTPGTILGVSSNRREVKPFIDIDLHEYERRIHSYSTYNNNRKPNRASGTAGSRTVMALALLSCIIVSISTGIAFMAAPKHGSILLNGTVNEPSNDNTETVGGATSIFHSEGKQDSSLIESLASPASGVKANKQDGMIKGGGEEEEDSSSSKTKEQIEDASTLLDTSGVPQTTRVDAIRFYLQLMGVTDPEQFQEADSAASRALQWLSKDDPAQLVVPGFDTTPNEHDQQYLAQLLQRYALAVFYFEMDEEDDEVKEAATDQESGNRLEFDLKWMLGDSVCDWPGIRCDEGDDEAVVALTLNHTLLIGTLPPELLNGIALPRLSRLDLSHNKIHGSIASLDDVRTDADSPSHALMHLQMSHNHITGSLDTLTHFRNLSFVDLSYNSFHGQMSDALVQLSNLNFLSLYGNRFTGEIPTSVGALRNVTSLLLDDNKFEGTIPADLGKLEKLETLRLLENHLVGTIPTEVCQLVNGGNLTLLIADCASGDVVCDCCHRCW